MLKIVKENTTQKFPHNTEVEQSLLGTLLHRNQEFEKVIDFLKPEHFFNQVHGRIYEVMRDYFYSNKPADPVTLQDSLNKEDLEAYGGKKNYLIQLADSVISFLSTEHYGRTIHDLYMRRELVRICEETTQKATDLTLDISALSHIEATERSLYDISSDLSLNQSATMAQLCDDFRRRVAKARAQGNKLLGISTGFCELDRILRGLQECDLLVLAARPAMGKTALATNIAVNVAKKNLNVGFFSLEMSKEQLFDRIISQESGLSYDKVILGDISDKDSARVIEAKEVIKNFPIHIEDRPGLNIVSLRTRARRIKRKFGLDLLIVDYLQLLRAERKIENRVNEIAYITQGLKSIAMELSVPVLALSQLSRESDKEGRVPFLSDLRDSGSIEQDADVVMFIHRQAYYHARKEPNRNSTERAKWEEEHEKIKNEAELHIAKHRRGMNGKIPLFFDSKITRFDNLLRNTGVF